MRNPIYEQALEGHGVKWAYVEDVPLTQIDRKHGLLNQARLAQAILPRLKNNYSIAYKQGAKFPPLVVHRSSSNGLYVPLDGSQRLAACDVAGINSHDVYVVESTDQMVLDRIAWSINDDVNGERLTHEECVQHAVSFVLKYGDTIENVAVQWKVKASVVKKKVRCQQLRDSLAKAKVKLKPTVTDDVLFEVAGLEKLGEDIFIPVVETLSSNGCGSKEARELKEKVNKAKTHATKLAAIRDFHNSESVVARKGETKSGTVKRPRRLPRQRIEKGIQDILKLLDAHTDQEGLIPPTADAEKAFRAMAAELVRKLIQRFDLTTITQDMQEEAG